LYRANIVIATIFDTFVIAGCKTTIETSGPTAQGLAGTPGATGDEDSSHPAVKADS